MTTPRSGSENTVANTNGALVDGQAPPQPPSPWRRRPGSGPAHGQAQVVVRDTQISSDRGGGPAPGQIGEEPERPLRGAAPADALEPLIEGPLPAGLVRTDESAYAPRQGEHQ